jgi:hypothetical protein
LVIVGLPRSGTTLVATLLAAQAGITFLTDYFSAFAEALERLGKGWNASLNTSERRIALALVRDQFLRVRHAVLVKQSEFDTLDALHERVLAELAGEQDAWVGHKLLLAPSQLRATLAQTQLRCLLLVRDPRDAAISYFHRTGGGVERYLRNWCETVRLWQDLREHPRLFGLRFEDLVAHPSRSLERLGVWLGQRLDAAPVELQFRRSAAHGDVVWRENSAFGDVRERFDQHSLERWRSHGESPIVRYAGWVARAELDELGYPSVAPIRLGERMRFSCLGALEAGEHRAHAALGSTARWLRQRLILQRSGWAG